MKSDTQPCPARPGKPRLALANHALRQAAAYAGDAVRATGRRPGACDAPGCIDASANDHRFADTAWQRYPFNRLQQAFLLQEDWWREATTGVHGVWAPHEPVVAFAARQWLDKLAPSNAPLTNPEIVDATLQHGGMNLLQGAKAWMDDEQRAVMAQPPASTEHFLPGREAATTPGRVVLRNRLIELIQCCPNTPQLCAEPVLSVPAWIMKHRILDLSPQNSLASYLVNQGHSVFMISWTNPGSEDRNLGMDDCHKPGLLAALAAVQRIVPGTRCMPRGTASAARCWPIARSPLRDHLCAHQRRSQRRQRQRPGPSWAALALGHAEARYGFPRARTGAGPGEAGARFAVAAVAQLAGGARQQQGATATLGCSRAAAADGRTRK